MAILSRETILNASDLTEETIYVKEWNGDVKIRAFSLAQRINVLNNAMRGTEVDPLRATAITFIEGVIEPKFTQADYEALRLKSNAAITRINNRIMAISGIGESAVEEAAKNSETTQSDASNTS